MESKPQRRIVHPVCDSACTHANAEPGPKPIEDDGLDWAFLQGFINDAVVLAEIEALPVWTGDGPAPFDPSVQRRNVEPEPEPYPQPEVSSRDGVMGPWKDAPLALARFAIKHGWGAMTTYARGCPPHARLGTPLAVKHSIAVRMDKDGVVAFAVYMGASSWTWDSMWIWPSSTHPTKYETITAFKEALACA